MATIQYTHYGNYTVKQQTHKHILTIATIQYTHYGNNTQHLVTHWSHTQQRLETKTLILLTITRKIKVILNKPQLKQSRHH